MKSRFPIVELGKHVRQVSQRNRADTDVEVYSVTNSEGFTKSTDYFSKEVFSKDVSNYKVVSPGQFAYNPSRINVGSIDYLRHHKSVLVSPLYIVFEGGGDIHADYLLRYLKSDWGNAQIRANTEGAVRDSLKFKGLERIKVPLPPRDDQVRLAHLLAKVEGLIAKRKQHLQQLDDLLKSVFLEMFGDPVRNEKKWKTQPFSQVGKFISGGTPSKSRDDYWVGEYPWVSPKDMKTPRIFDSEDHISEKVFNETSLKRIAPGHLLIVVRGMILAHSFPVAINMIDVAINQDMKAIKLNDNLRTDYVFHCLSALKRQILKLITTAGHGTKKFDSDVMEKLLVPVPPSEMQDDFISIAYKVEVLKSCYQQSLAELEAIYSALSQQAFKGELDLSRVPIPGVQAEEEKAVPVDPLHAAVEQSRRIHLPAPPNLPAALESTEARKNLFAQWLDAYLGQLGSPPFSVQHFMAAAQTRLAELHPDNDFELSASDYEHIKAWVFDALRAGRLAQAFDDTGNRIELKAVQA